MRKNNKNKRKKADIKQILLGSTMLIAFCTVIVASILFLSQVGQPIVEKEIKEHLGEWKIVGDHVPDGDASGFMYFMTYPHQADPYTAYASNLTNASAYEYTDNISSEMWGETPYDATFDFAFKFRVNDTVGYNSSGSKWEIDWVRVNVTIDFDYATDVSALTNCTIVEIANTTDFAWYHGYIQDADSGVGSGFTITHSESYNVTEVRLEIEY